MGDTMSDTTTARPEPVRLTDLAAPEFSPDARAIIDAVAPMAEGVQLSPEPLMAAAVAQTGLDDFGPMDFVERLDVLTGALEAEAGLSPMGRVSAAGMLTGCPQEAVLVLHSPPQGHCDSAGDGTHFGSPALLRAIEDKRPRLAVCGHIHESWGCESQVGPTPVRNLGPRGTWLEV